MTTVVENGVQKKLDGIFEGVMKRTWGLRSYSRIGEFRAALREAVLLALDAVDVEASQCGCCPLGDRVRKKLEGQEVDGG